MTAPPTGLASLGETAHTRALARFAQLRPHLEEGVPLPQVAREQGVSVRTARRWVQHYRQQGLAGLAGRPGRIVGSIGSPPTCSA